MEQALLASVNGVGSGKRATAAPSEGTDHSHPAVIAAALFAVVIWAGTSVFTKVAVDRFDPLLVGVMRSVIGGAAAAAFLPMPRLGRPQGRLGWGLLLVSAVGGFIMLPLAYSFGQRLTSASHGALILASLPIQAGLIAAIVDRRWPHRRWWLGSAVAFVGEAVLIGSRIGLGDSASAEGDLLILFGALGSAIGYVSGARLAFAIGTRAVTLWGNALGGLLMLPLLLWFGRGADWSGAGTLVWATLFYLGICSSLLAYLAWYWALAKGGIARVSVFQYTQPIFAVIMAMILLGERPGLPVAAASAIILCGLYLTRRR
jgi:drug/metabolite transporter (DMT)-like permease